MSADRQTVFVSGETFRAVVSMDALIEAMRSAYDVPPGPQEAPPRSIARGEGVWLRTSSAILPTGMTMGAKVFASSRVRGVGYVITLFDQERGDLLAIVDAKDMTAMRTAATSALAVDCLAPDTPAIVAMIGSGLEARSHLAAMAAVRRLAEVRIYSPTPKNREGLAEEARREYGVECRAMESAAEAIRGASLVVSAARSRDETPVLDGDWLEAAATVVSIGSTLPEQREVDVRTIARADLIVADLVDEVTEGTGDFMAARSAGLGFDHKVCSLSELVSGRRARTQGAMALYKSVGSGLQDIAAAELAYLEATRRGLAVPLPMELSIKRSPRIR